MSLRKFRSYNGVPVVVITACFACNDENVYQMVFVIKRWYCRADAAKCVFTLVIERYATHNYVCDTNKHCVLLFVRFVSFIRSVNVLAGYFKNITLKITLCFRLKKTLARALT